MSPTDREQQRDAIRRTLTIRTGEIVNAKAVAGAARSTWQRLEAQLFPVIGERGFDALFGRALHLTRAQHPWLDGGEERGPAEIAAFLQRLEAREARAGAEASHAVLVTFTELLTTLIGSTLTERLLAPVWAEGHHE